MESSYASEDVGGAMPNNLIPNLTHLALDEGIHFSNTNKLGGALPVPGAMNTVCATVAQTAGIPLRFNLGIDENEYSTLKGDTAFLPGVYTLGDILDEAGYNQVYMSGSEASYAGRLEYFTEHGNYRIKDYNWAINNDVIPSDYRIWWGYEDRKVFKAAKKVLKDLSQKNEPFNLTLLTTDTHALHGLLYEDTPDLFNDQYQNVIHFSDDMLYKFIEWIQMQPFYKDTTIVISGDHLTMNPEIFADLDPDYQRAVYDVILNSPIKPVQNNPRLFAAMDLYPTTLAALGVKIEGDRLGLGTNLFSKRETLIEELGYKHFYEELQKKSRFYEREFLKNIDLTHETNK